jgi:hypothetical protein
MSLSIHLHSIRSLNESSEASASDEAYVLVTVATLRPPLPGLPIPAVPNFRVFQYGIFTDLDDDEGPVSVNGAPFWGMDGVAEDIANPDEVAIVVSVLEHDNGSPAQYAELVNARTGVSLGASLGAPNAPARAARLTSDISNVLNGIDLPIPFALDDDHIGTQQLKLDQSDLIDSGQKQRVMRVAGDGAEFELVFSIRRLPHWASPFPIAPPGNAASRAVTALARRAEQLDVFWVGPDGGVGTTAWNPPTGWIAPFPIAAGGHAAPGAVTVVARRPDNLDVFWVGPDGGVGTTAWNPATGWIAPFPIAPAGHAAPGAITAVARGQDLLDVFWVGPDGGVGTTAWTPATGWIAPFPIAPAGHAAPGAIAALARHPEQLDVFWVGPDGGVGTTAWNPPTGWIAPFPIAPAGHAAPGAIAAVARHPEQLDVFWVGPDGGVGATAWG